MLHMGPRFAAAGLGLFTCFGFEEFSGILVMVYYGSLCDGSMAWRLLISLLSLPWIGHLFRAFSGGPLDTTLVAICGRS